MSVDVDSGADCLTLPPLVVGCMWANVRAAGCTASASVAGWANWGRRMTKQGGRRNGGWRRYKVLFGLAAIGAFLLALPAAAMACVSANQCTSGGGFVSINVCVGGSQNNEPICNSTQASDYVFAHRLGNAYATHGMYSFNDLSENITNDPFVDFTSIHDRGASVSSATGAISGQNASSHTTDLGGGAIGGYNGWNKTLNLSANQSLVAAAQVGYDSSRTTFGASTLAPGFLNVASTKESRYSLAGALMYYAGSIYFGGALGGDWGHGDMTSTVTGAAGNYGIHGYSTTAIVGKVFTLSGSASAPSPAAAMPTKAPPKPSAAGNALQLDLSAHLGYSSDQANGFTDSTGFVWGAERLRFWDAGGTARLFETIPDGRLTWIPYVALKLDQQFGYSDALALPTIGNTVFYGSAQTFWGTQFGVGVRDTSGIIVGVRGMYAQSSEFQILGGQAYLQYAFQ